MSATALWLYLGGAAFLALVALMLFAWAMLSDRSRGRRRCPKCWYAIHADAAVLPIRCSECGRQIRRDRELYRTCRRWKPAGISALILFIAAFLALQPKVQPYGWGSMTPMTVLLLLLEVDHLDWVHRGISYQMNNDLFNRRRAPDFLDPFDPAMERAMWRWQWRWLGRTSLSRLNDANLDAQLRRTYLAWLALSHTFSGDSQLRDAAAPLLLAELGRDDSWSQHVAPGLSIDYRDVDASIERLLLLLSSDADAAVWGAMLGLRAIALRDHRAVELLISLLDHEDPRVRSGATSSLGFVVRRNGHDSTIYEAVLAMRSDEDCNVRWARIVSLANMLAGDEQWRLIEDAMRSDDICVRRGGFSAASTHCRERRARSPVTPESVIALAMDSISDEDESIRWNAAWVIEEVARDRRQRRLLMPHVEAIEALDEHEDPVVNRAIAWALHYLGRQ